MTPKRYSVDPIRHAWEALHRKPFPAQLEFDHRTLNSNAGNSRNWNINPAKGITR